MAIIHVDGQTIEADENTNLFEQAIDHSTMDASAIALSTRDDSGHAHSGHGAA